MKNFSLHTTTLFAFIFLSFATVAHATATASNLSASMNEDGGSRNITLNATTTIKNETLTYSIVTKPAHGSVSLSSKTATYTPTANYNGTDTFTYKATGSSSGSSNTATVTINIAAVNDVPVATSGLTATTPKNTPVNIQLSGTDVDGDSLSYSAVAAMAGTFSVNATTGIGTFTPAANFTGTTTATFKVYDGKAYSPNANVTITVNATNTAPVANDQSVTLNEDASKQISLSATDADNNTLTYRIISNPLHGSVNLSGHTATYTPTANYNGQDTFTFVANDATVDSQTATISLSISAVNDTPTANNISTSTNNETPVSIVFQGNDVDSDALTYLPPAFITGGTLSTISGNSATFTPNTDFYGTTTFTYGVSDPTGAFASATATINVSAVPVARKTVIDVANNTPVTFSLEPTDQDSQSLQVTVSGELSFGTLTQNSNGTYTYTPNTDLYGMEELTYTATDGTYTSTPGSLIINVFPKSGTQTAKVQAGVNFMSFQDTNGNDSSANVLANLKNLGVQAVRYIGEADTLWSSVEKSDNNDSSSFGNSVRQQLVTNNLTPTNALFRYMFASCTPPWADYTDENQFVHTMDATCKDYLSRAADAIIAGNGGDQNAISYVEIGNELYHWVSYPFYSTAEQAAVLDYTQAYIHTRLPNAIIVRPSITLSEEATYAWSKEVDTAIGNTSWFNVENVHVYDGWERLYAGVTTYLNDGRHHPKMLMSATETGQSDDPTASRTSSNITDMSGAQTKIAAIFKNFSMLWSGGFSSVYWHSFLNSTDNSDDLRGCGLINADGTWEPAGYTLKLLISELVPFTKVTDLSSRTDLSTMVFHFTTDNGGSKYVTWGSGSWVVPAGVSQMTSAQPNEDGTFSWQNITPGQTIQLTNMPILAK